MRLKIISGGQRGADRAALEAAKAIGIPTGGTAPKGWRICLPNGSDAADPDLADFGLIEHASREYPPRTKQNVADSDGTVWVGYEHSPGGKLTLSTAKKLGKPAIVNPTAIELRQWVEDHCIGVLNVAGNRESPDNPDIFPATYELIIEAFQPAKSR